VCGVLCVTLVWITHTTIAIGNVSCNLFGDISWIFFGGGDLPIVYIPLSRFNRGIIGEKNF
jgi:hypothetical protein